MNSGRPQQRIVIASRESALALWQARHIQLRLAALYPGAEFGILGLTTEGDRRLDVALAKIGGKGLFVKELEDALAGGRADIAVHSVKDLPMELPRGFILVAIAAWISRKSRSWASRANEAPSRTSSYRYGSAAAPDASNSRAQQ